MLSDPKRLRTRRGHGYLVSWKHRLRTKSERDAAEVAERLLRDPANIESLRGALGRSGASLDELAEWLVRGLASGSFSLLKTRVNPPVLDVPPETNLVDLLPPQEPKPELDSLTFEIIDNTGDGADIHYQLFTPSGDPSGALPSGERCFVGQLESDARVEVEFSRVVLGLRPEPRPVQPEPVQPKAPPKPAPTGGDPSTHGPPRVPGRDITTATFEARVVDELGQPLGGVPLTFLIEGASRSSATGADGTVRIEAGATAGTLTFDDPAGLTDLLAPRWEQLRNGEWLDAAEHHTYLSPTAVLPVVQLRADQPHTLVLQPKVLLARIRGMLFDTNRSFLLPAALDHLPRLTAVYSDHPNSDLLLVGHTDVTGEPNDNDPLSLERAESVSAFLRDDAAAWLANYEASRPVQKRWGAYEDTTMLTAVFDRSGEHVSGSPLRHFQQSRGLDPDGIAGPVTREALIGEYMALDGTTLPIGVDIQVYGCGERFPLEDGDNDTDRRVELFFFDRPLGVLPARPADLCPSEDETYVHWLRRAAETDDLDTKTRVYAIILDDPIFGVAAEVSVEAMYQGGKQVSVVTDDQGRLPLEPGGGAFVDLRYTANDREVERRVFTAVDDVASPQGAWQRLVHLGYSQAAQPEREAPDNDAFEDALMLFQLDHGLEPTHALDDETVAELLRSHDQDLRPWQERDWELPDEPDAEAPTPKSEVS